MVESVDDVIAGLPQYETMIKKSHTVKDFIDVNSNFKLPPNVHRANHVTNDARKRVLDLLSAAPVNCDYLQQMSELPLPVLYTILLELELAGRITRHPGNRISLIYI